MPVAVDGVRSPSSENTDPILIKLAETDTFECDWPTLRHHLYLALVDALPLFLKKGPPVSYAGRIMVEPAQSPNQHATGADGQSLLLSPSRPQGWMVGEAGRGVTPPHNENPDLSLRPTTQGGLVIPPFPPLDATRRRAQESPIPNGNPNVARGNPFEDEWDEEVVIGGRKLPGWMEEEEGRQAIQTVANTLESLTVPPFTIQRLAELLIAPTKLHSSLGKFLRAVDKMLVVTTPYSPPSFNYVPPTSLPLETLSGSPLEPSATTPRSPDSTVPPGSMTPMFYPIPFLSSSEVDALGEPMMDGEAQQSEGRLMSPLMLDNGTFSSQQEGRRSPTPEPQDADMAEPQAETGHANGSEASDPGHQPYLGRVDELDAGPIGSNGHSDEDGVEASRLGERGEMLPHGMSSHPVPLSSTTVISETEREIAPLPRSASRVDVQEGADEVKEEPAGEVVEGDTSAAEVKESEKEGKTEDVKEEDRA